jgi:hypothetical protein
MGGGTPYQADDLQKYPLGTMLRMGGRTYAYAKSSGTQIPDVGSQVGDCQQVPNCAVQANYAAGVSVITITAAATAGKAHNGVIAADELVGGYVVVFPASTNHAFIRQIIANSVCIISQANTLSLTLDSPTPLAITTAATAECMGSPYLDVITAASQIKPVIGVPTVAATDGQFFWLQTWGPCWCAPAADVGTGNDNAKVLFVANGSLAKATTGIITDQPAGFVLSQVYGGGQGAPFFMLQITP